MLFNSCSAGADSKRNAITTTIHSTTGSSHSVKLAKRPCETPAHVPAMAMVTVAKNTIMARAGGRNMTTMEDPSPVERTTPDATNLALVQREYRWIKK
jgi:hypothetical protein